MRTTLLIAVAFWLGAIDTASAQGPTWRPGPGGFGQGVPNQGPAVSPYLNLYRRGSSLAVNYYGLVRPAIDIRGAVEDLQQQVTDLPAPGTGVGAADGLGPLVTSTRTRFMNTGNYFMSGVPLGGNRAAGGFGQAGGGSVVVVGMQSPTPAATQGAQMGGSIPAASIRRR